MVQARLVTALVYTLGVFGLILLLARLKVPLAAAILLGAAAMGMLFGFGPWQTAVATGRGAIQPIAIALVVITILLLSLSETMRAAGVLERIVTLARGFLRRPTLAMAALPALIGLLPMPAGALFSAPMVETAAGGGKVSGGRLSAINYWFRHIWEHWWPLYPGVILAATLTHSSLGSFVGFQIPLGIFMAAAGLLIFRGIHPHLHAPSDVPPARLGSLVRATSPIWVILIIWAGASGAIRALPAGVFERPGSPAAAEALETIRRFGPITLGLVVSLIWTIRSSRLSAREVQKVLGRGRLYSLTALVISVMVFQHVLKQVGAAPRIAEELTSLSVPVPLVVVILPFVAGMVTGIAIGFVGTSFPIVVALVEAMPAHPAMRPYVVLAYACGHLGMMLSPLHLCHVVSNRYFKTGFPAVYRHILAPALLTGALAAGYFLALAALMG